MPIRLMDTTTGRALFGTDSGGSRLDDFPVSKDEKLFPGGKKIRYDGRFLLEGLRFATEAQISLAIYNTKTKKIVAQDVARVATTPWLANHHQQPIVDLAAWGIAKYGNLVNSQSYPFANNYGSTLFKAGDDFEFVQDSVEWGYQVRRQNPATNSRVMITALRLYTGNEDKHPLKFANAKVGVYGWNAKDDQYFENAAAKKDGDAGGNLECLPPAKVTPFGRIIYGDYMSDKLKNFLTLQGVQFGVQLNISGLGFPHVDEVMCIVPTTNGYVVIVPDWDAGHDIIKNNPKVVVSALRIVVPDSDTNNPTGIKVLSKYADILDYLDNSDDGKKWSAKYRDGLNAVAKQLKIAGVTVLRLPGMFFETPTPLDNPMLRGWPRNIANCQVVNPMPGDPGTLIVSKPPPTDDNAEDPFLTQWKAIFKQQNITIGLEDVTTAWLKGGEVHCSSNGIREPMKQ
jgi:Protein-arginine deiminase (PAD)